MAMSSEGSVCRALRKYFQFKRIQPFNTPAGSSPFSCHSKGNFGSRDNLGSC